MTKLHIFVADDDEGFLELMQSLLQEEGYRVTKLRVSDEAYEEIIEDRPDLIMLDLILAHGVSGLRVLDKIKLNPYTANVPVIICSADRRALSEGQDILEGLNCIIFDKPFDIDELLQAIRQALRSTQAPSN